VSVGEDLSKAVWHETQNLTSAQRSAARNNIQAADQMTVDFHSTQISDLETGKQDKLTFDSTPTAGSSNPVTSAGIKTVTDALAGDVDDLKSAFNFNIKQKVYPEDTTFFDAENLIDFLASAYDSLFSVSSADVLRAKQAVDVDGKTGGGVTNIMLPLTVAAGTAYKVKVVFACDSGSNVRVYKDSTNIAGLVSGTERSFTAEENHSYYLRIYVSNGGYVHISSAYLRSTLPVLGSSYINKDYSQWVCNRTYEMTWNTGKINTNGTIDTSLTNLKYSNAIPIVTGRQYSLANNKSFAELAYFDEEPTIGETVPKAKIPIQAATWTADRTGYASFTVPAGDISNIIYNSNVISEIDAIAEGGGNGGSGTNTKLVVEQTQIVNSVENRVIDTQIETVSGARFASNYGVLPSASASTNKTNLQALLDDGGTVVIDVPGIYEFSECLMIGSNTSLICYNGVYFKQDNTGGMILNKGALTKEFDTNIVIDGLNFIDGGHTGHSATYVPGLRGKIAFYYAKNVVLRNIVCTDLDANIFFIHLAKFENVLIENCIIKGQKDGIHVSCGDGLTIRGCILGTHDDEIALNAHDYLESCPELGWIRNVLIENCRNEAGDGVTPGSRGLLFLGGAWLDWSPNQYQRGDAVVGQNGYVYRLVAEASVDGNGNPVLYASTDEPTHSSGDYTYPDGITWRCIQHNTMYNCGLENVTIRNYRFEVDHNVLFLLNADGSRYSRGVYPNAVAVPFKNLTFENVSVNKAAYTGYEAFLNLCYPCEFLRINNCDFVGYAVFKSQYQNWEPADDNDVFHVAINGSKFAKSSMTATMLVAYLQNAIDLIVDAGFNYVPDALSGTVSVGTLTFINNDLTT
jgi:hypothetical protein